MRSLFGLRSISQALNIDSRDVLARMGGATGQKLIANMGPRQQDWFRIVNKADEPDRAQVFLYDEIGWFGTTASDFADELRDIKAKQIDVHINSIGGSVFDGIAIYNALRTHDAYVTTQVDSAALSIASVIAQAGDRRVMVSGSQMMIHEAWGVSIGNADDMREYGELLDRMTGNIADIYAERTNAGDRDDFLAMMSKDTWLTAKEAVDVGLADEMLTPAVREPEEDEDGEDEQTDAAARWGDFIAAAAQIT